MEIFLQSIIWFFLVPEQNRTVLEGIKEDSRRLNDVLIILFVIFFLLLIILAMAMKAKSLAEEKRDLHTCKE